MDSILQGTTPTLEVVIDTDDFMVENVTAAPRRRMDYTLKQNIGIM